MFPRVCILGGGLLGGSLALALKQLQHAPQVRTWFRREQVVPEAAAAGIPGATADLSLAVHDAELAVLAVPVGAMLPLMEEAVAAGLPTSCLITDVGSVKSLPHQSLRPLLDQHRMAFIGSHPMAGSERKGLVAVDPDLFRHAACLLTNDDQADPQLCSSLEEFWREVGCRTKWMSAAEHDALVAAISHLPHIAAAGTARISLANPSLGTYGGGGLRDTTRVASGNPEMWAEIVTENRQAIAPLLRSLIADLALLLESLDSCDRGQALKWLTEAKELRDQINPEARSSEPPFPIRPT